MTIDGRLFEDSGTPTMSLRAFARQLRVSDTAIRKAIESGRLRRGVGQIQGRPAIVDPRAAAEEWKETGTRREPRPPAAARKDGPTLADVQRAVALERARKLKLDNDVREGLLVPVDQVELAQRTIAGAVRASLLALPRLAVVSGLPPEHEPLIKRLIVEALRDLSETSSVAALAAKGAA